MRGDKGDGGGGQEAEGHGQLEHQHGGAQEGGGDGQAATGHEPAVVGLEGGEKKHKSVFSRNLFKKMSESTVGKLSTIFIRDTILQPT